MRQDPLWAINDAERGWLNLRFENNACATTPLDVHDCVWEEYINLQKAQVPAASIRHKMG